jgi:hypothetical protein
MEPSQAQFVGVALRPARVGYRCSSRQLACSCDKSQRLGMDALLYLTGFLGEIDLHSDVSHLEQ